MKIRVLKTIIWLQSFVCLLAFNVAYAGEYPLTLEIAYGTTPTLDGTLDENEYADAAYLEGVADWESDTHTPAGDPNDLSVKAWFKHDGEFLYFAFDVTDDVLYGYDIERWVHSNNLTPHAMNYTGWPWFGDGMEIMMNASYTWNGADECAGDAKSWQLVFSSHKSWADQLDKGGLMMGEPRKDYAWDHYREWIENGHVQAAHRLKTEEEGRGYVVEWKIDPTVCMQNSKGEYIDLQEECEVGINFEFQDLDEKEKGQGNWSNMHHIDYLAQVGSYRKTALISYATLLIVPKPSPSGVNILSLNRKIKVYPKPAHEFLYIEANSTENMRVDIYDLNGRIIRSLAIGTSAKVDISDLKKGVYLLKFRDLENYIQLEKIMIY